MVAEGPAQPCTHSGVSPTRSRLSSSRGAGSFGDHLRCLDVAGAGAEARARHRQRRRRSHHRVPVRARLATPMSIMVGVGRGAQEGVLVKNAEALERLEKVDTLVVDKTGTLTEGKPKLVDVRPADGFDAKEFVRLAASLEQNSEHPLAAAIVQGAREQSLTLEAVKDFRSVTAGGVAGSVAGRAVMIGKPDFLRNEKVTVWIRWKRRRRNFKKRARPRCSWPWMESLREFSPSPTR